MMQPTGANFKKYTDNSYNSTKKSHNPIKKIGRRHRHFSKEGIQMAKKQVKRCSKLLSIREMPNQTYNQVVCKLYIYINHTQYYSAIIKNVTLSFETTWMDLGNIKVSQISSCMQNL